MQTFLINELDKYYSTTECLGARSGQWTNSVSGFFHTINGLWKKPDTEVCCLEEA